MGHKSTQELEAGLERIRLAPSDEGSVELIVRRPAVGEREVLAQAELDLHQGLVGDNWRLRAGAHPDMQLNIMNSRACELIAGEREHWPFAGDQLYLDLDLGAANLPPGTRLEIGGAVIEVTDQPHTGCLKFKERFGGDALRFVNSPAGRALNARGINARVVQAGSVRQGDRVRKLCVAASEHSSS